MAKEKDIIIRRKDGLFVMKREDRSIGFTTLARATHFTGEAAARKVLPGLVGWALDIVYIDLNRRGAKALFFSSL